MYNIFNKYKSGFLLLLKVLIVGSAYYIISEKIGKSEFLQNEEFIGPLQTRIFQNPYLLFYFFLFTFFNWYFEILKWKTLASTVSKITFYEALKQSLFSLTASLLTPNRIGEYGAKALYFNKRSRAKVLFLNFLGNFNQMFITTLFGLIGTSLLVDQIPFKLDLFNFKTTGFVMTLILLVVLVSNKKILLFCNKVVTYFKGVTLRLQLSVLCFSFIRYLFFSHQFYFLLLFFGVDIEYTLAMRIIFAMYFLASIIPGFVVFDWLIKGSVALTLFGVYNINEILILSITSLMWLANFALPAIIGSFYVLTFNGSDIENLERNVITS